MENGKRNVVFENLSFTFPEGKNIALLGQNGAGKSTMLSLIAGSDFPDSGQIIRSKRISWPLGFGGAFHPSLTGEENLRFACRIYHADLKKVKAYVEEFTELGEYLYQPVKTYSAGMRAKLAFGLSLAIQFDVYLIDEITGVGDPQFKKKSKEAIADLKRNAYIIMVSHSMSTLRENCDTALVLKDGRMHAYENLEDGIAVYQGRADDAVVTVKPAPEKKADKDSKELIRSLQMHYIKKKSAIFGKQGAPVVLIDTKRRKPGDSSASSEDAYYFNNADEIDVAAFLEGEKGNNISSGVYDLARDRGWVCAGIYLDGVKLAVSGLRSWWYDADLNCFADANKIYVVYLNAGRNVLNNRAIKKWNAGLQKLADELNITFHVSFVPPGPRPWKLIRNRIFNFNVESKKNKKIITQAAVVSLVGVESKKSKKKKKIITETAAVGFINNANIEHELKIKARLDELANKEDVALSSDINTQLDDFYGKWNYRIYPNV